MELVYGKSLENFKEALEGCKYSNSTEGLENQNVEARAVA